MGGGNARAIDLNEEDFGSSGSESGVQHKKEETGRTPVESQTNLPPKHRSSLKLDKGKTKVRDSTTNKVSRGASSSLSENHNGTRNDTANSVTEGSEDSTATTGSASSKPTEKVNPLGVTIIIKMSDGSFQDIPLEIDNILEVTVSQLRRMIRQKAGGTTLNRRLRLIYGGKILNDLTNVAVEVAGVELAPDSASISTTGSSSKPAPKVVKGPKSKRIYVHCAIGDILTPAELAKEGEYDKRIPTRSTLPELRGFDRLRDTGFTDEDIVQLRQQFGRLYGTSPAPGATSGEAQPNSDGVVDTTGVQGDRRNEEEMTRLEEQWIETGVADGPPDIAALMGGDYLDDLVGTLIGMFLGILVVILVNESSTLFSKRQQKFILLGSAVNISYALLRNLR
ncbi:Dsc3p [Sugiyamaella lignohabitans]|uniref:Dsc3p n=1 Tax=Sugiyamaella lignohabitans TaxID=796027 RepID=A0A167DSY6_9ASCO|nr:Dsc3p [Sugiyamaella lignohabitans]ANB13258.1 Dsc3p [Sugiyamaella lignohabitans]